MFEPFSMMSPRPALVRAARGLAVGLLLTLTACGGGEAEFAEMPVEDLYNGALNQLDAGEWEDAAAAFDEVERQHPYSVWASRAQLMAAYAHYENDAYDEAILTAQRFIELQPGHRDAPYAYYLVAISYYEQITDVGRDQGITENAVAALDEVIVRYPRSQYARDAQLKMDLARDHLAGKEMEIGRFYQTQRQWLAAINRFQRVIEQYQTTTHVPEALHRLVESYLALGVAREAQSTAAVLGYNYPGTDWYVDSYALLNDLKLSPTAYDDSWIVRQWKRIVP